MPGTLNVAGHDIPVVRMVARQGSRIEPLIYWMTLDGKPENSQVKLKLDQVRSSLMRGEVADGMIFRVSVIDADSARAYRIESDFLNDFFHGVGPRARRNFFGVST
jgi:EpsI family protein